MQTTHWLHNTWELSLGINVKRYWSIKWLRLRYNETTLGKQTNENFVQVLISQHTHTIITGKMLPMILYKLLLHTEFCKFLTIFEQFLCIFVMNGARIIFRAHLSWKIHQTFWKLCKFAHKTPTYTQVLVIFIKFFVCEYGKDDANERRTLTVST